MSFIFMVGDHIKKSINNLIINNTIYKIIDLKEVKGGNWHDGFDTSIIATISCDSEPEIDEYCVQYTNNMCQIKSTFAIKLI
jgi:hypothetical protein